MNTKQLWCALTMNYYTNPHFDGIYSIDTLKNIKEKPELIICNTDPSDKPGEHWVLFFFDNDGSVDFYNSLGRDINFYGSEFLDFVMKFATKNLKQCMVRTQPINSSLCGQYCLYYALAKCLSYSMKKIVSSMISSEDILNFVNENFYCGNDYCSPLLQKCMKC